MSSTEIHPAAEPGHYNKIFERKGIVLTMSGADAQCTGFGDLERLERVYMAVARSGKTAAKIIRLDDHKGCLSVYWLTRPNMLDRVRVETIWGSAVADGACGEENPQSVGHFIIDKLYELPNTYEIVARTEAVK